MKPGQQWHQSEGLEIKEGNRLRLLVCDKQQQEKRCREADQEDPEFFVRDWWDEKEKKNTSGS